MMLWGAAVLCVLAALLCVCACVCVLVESERHLKWRFGWKLDAMAGDMRTMQTVMTRHAGQIEVLMGQARVREHVASMRGGMRGSRSAGSLM